MENIRIFETYKYLNILQVIKILKPKGHWQQSKELKIIFCATKYRIWKEENALYKRHTCKLCHAST